MAAIRNSTSPPEAGDGEDRALLNGVTAGDARAFTALYLQHARRVARVVYRVLGDDRDLDDVVQETFLHAAGRITALRDATAVEAWLVAIAVRRARRLLKRRRVRQRLLSLWFQAAPGPGHGAVVAWASELGHALASLPPDLRIPWVLHHVEGMSLPETASACRVSLATVKRRIARAEVLLEGGET